MDVHVLRSTYIPHLSQESGRVWSGDYSVFVNRNPLDDKPIFRKPSIFFQCVSYPTSILRYREKHRKRRLNVGFLVVNFRLCNKSRPVCVRAHAIPHTEGHSQTLQTYRQTLQIDHPRRSLRGGCGGSLCLAVRIIRAIPPGHILFSYSPVAPVRSGRVSTVE